MLENAERQSVEEVLQSSELAARLLRRLITSPGVVDTQQLFRTYARLTELITHVHPLLQDLLARYCIDELSASQNLPLVMDQPWMLNLNTYLTNNSSSSSTTTNNSFYATANQFISQAIISSSTHTELHDTTSHSSPPEVFRVSRRPASPINGREIERVTAVIREGRQSVTADDADLVLNPVPKSSESLTPPSMVYVEGKGSGLAKAELTWTQSVPPAVAGGYVVDALGSKKAAHPPATAGGTDSIQQRSSTFEAKHQKNDKAPQATGTPQIAFARTDSAVATPQALTLVNRQIDPMPLRETVVNSASENRPSTENSIMKPNASASSRPAVPLVQEQLPSTQFQTRPPKFVWRKSTDNQMFRDLLSDVSGSTASAAVRQVLDSIPAAESPPSAPTAKHEPSHREDEPPAGAEITTEAMLRRISRMLLIERERRGY